MKKRVPLLVLTIAMLIMSIVGSASASSLSVDMEQLTTDIAGYVSAWVVDNYSEHYSLSHYSGEVAECEVKGSQFRAAVPVVVYTTLKYSSAESLPYMEGMKDALNIASFGDIASVASADRSGEFSRILSESNPNLDTEIVDDLAATLSSRYSDVEECIGTPTELFVDFVVTGHIVKGKMDKVSLYVDETGALIDASLYAPKSAEALADEGRSDTLNMLQEAAQRNEGPSERYYAYYDRIDARDYALEWTSDATTYCGCEENVYGIDHDCWNNDEYPYFTEICHADCADYVSQAMHAGGIPIDPGVWERCQDGDSGYGEYGWTWTAVDALQEYMIDKGYWDTSTYAVCNAGNILMTSSQHVVMVTLNDTVTHRYSGHTRDRRDCQFTNGAGYLYYAIKTSP